MAVIRNLVVKVGADISLLSKGLRQAQTKIAKVSQSLTKVGKSLTASVTLPLVGIGVAALKVSADFEQSMANAASVSGATAEEFEKMTALAREMGSTTVFSASQAADAMYYMASAGYKASQMASSIQPILDLAAATQSELAFTTDTVIATLNQFGLEADEAGRVTNVFASVIGSSQATLDKLAYSMRYVGPVAKSLGYSLEETTAALGLLYNSGFKGEQAGTVLRSALSKLLKPSKAITDSLGEMGLSYDDVNPSVKSLAEIIGTLEKAGITTAQAVAIFGQEAGPGMMALIGQGSDALKEMTDKITDTNAAGDMAEKQLNTTQGAIKLMKSQLEELCLQIGEVLLPVINSLIKKYLTPFIAKLSSLNKTTMETIIKIAGIAAAIGPLLLLLGKAVGITNTLIKVVSFLTLKNALLFGGLALLAYAIGKTLAENEDFRNSIKDLMKAVGKLIVTAVSPLLDVVISLAPTITKVATAIGKMVAWVVKAVTAVIDWLDKTKLLDFALFLLGTTLAVVAVVKVVAFIGSIWSAVTAIGAFILAAGTKAVQAIGKFVVTLMVNAMFALGSFKLALVSVCAGLAAMAAGVVLAFYVFTNWDTMNGIQRVIAVIGVLTVVLLGAALAFGIFHSAWSLGLAVAGIIAGIVAVVAAVETSKSNIPDGDKVDTKSMANNFSGNISGYAKGGTPPNSSLFYANEFGSPELVANFGGGTGVANNDMIVEAIEQAAYKGMSRAISQMPQGDNGKIAVIEINGREFARATFSDMKAEGKRRGDW